MFHQLRNLDTKRTDLKVRVRVTRMWPFVNEESNPTGMNLILLDSEDYHIHIYVPPDVWSFFENIVYEGNAYDFENFITRRPIGTLRPVSSNITIHLTRSTVVQPVPLEVITIPRHKFEITELIDIYNLAKSYGPLETPTYAIDIVGAVHDVDNARVVDTPLGSKTFLRFNLYDGRTIVKVVLWDDVLVNFNAVVQSEMPDRPIVLLSSVRPKFCFGFLQISSSRATRVYSNREINCETLKRVRLRILDQW